MSSRREVLIRILALLQKEDVNWNKKSHIKMLKMALFDCTINEKCCSVDGGRGICPLFSSPPRGIWQLKSPHPREFAIQGKKKMLMPGGQPGGGGLGAGGIDWCINTAWWQDWLITHFIKLLVPTLTHNYLFHAEMASLL